MSSWRDRKDPNCPECGEPISPTSQYCMHCNADLGVPNDSADVSDEDDWTRGSDSTDHDRGGVLSRLAGYLGGGTDDARRDSDRRSEPGRGTDHRTGTPGGPTTGPAAPLWLRAFTSFLVSIPVTLLAFFILVAVTDSLSGNASGLLLLTIWVGTIVYLVRKPLPSDIIGDAFYTLAGLILLGPVLGYAIMIVRALATSRTLGDGFRTLLVQLLAIEFTLLWPAAFFAAIGYAGNWWAAKKLRSTGSEPDQRG